MVNTMGFLNKISLESLVKIINHKISIMENYSHSNRIINILSKKVFRIYKIISKSNFKICKKIRIKKGNFKKMMKRARVMMILMNTMRRKIMVKSKIKMKHKMKAGNQNPKNILKEEMKIKKTMINQIQTATLIKMGMHMTHIKTTKGKI